MRDTGSEAVDLLGNYYCYDGVLRVSSMMQPGWRGLRHCEYSTLGPLETINLVTLTKPNSADHVYCLIRPVNQSFAY